MNAMTRTNRLVAAVVVAAAMAGPGSVGTRAAELRAHTTKAFDDYAASVEGRWGREASGTTGILAAAGTGPTQAGEVRREVFAGEVPVFRLAERDADGVGLEVPDGLVHHWRGVILVPGVTLDLVLEELQRPSAGRHVQEDVAESRVLARDGDTSRVYLRLVRRQIVTVTYATEHAVRYVRVDPRHAWSRSVSLRIAEVVDAGTPSEREQPVGQDRGFLWRLNSYWRYEQVPEGVLVELESLTLSRDVPGIIKPIARPIINHIARESMTRTLESVRARLLRAGARAAAGGGQR